MAKRQIGLGWVVVLMMSTTAYAATPSAPAISVFVDHTGEDPVGQSVTFQLREALSRSQLYPLAATREEALLVVFLVSMDQEACGVKQVSTVIAFSIITNNAARSHLYTGIQMAGRDVADRAAQSILATIDNAVATWRKGVGAR